jgi:hypothetical protein
MVGRRQLGCAVAVVLAAVTVARAAEAASARVLWTPSPDARIVGYKVWVRDPKAPYAAPRNAGVPLAALDGSMAFVVDGLTAGRTYYFAVSAYTADGTESALSGELALGAVDPCRIDRCVTLTACEFGPVSDGLLCDDGLFCNGVDRCRTGACEHASPPDCSDGLACTIDTCDEALRRCGHQARPGCCTTDAECADTDACTSNERCAAGTCVNLAVTCPTSPCGEAFCDPHAGCGATPLPDGIACNDRDPCSEGGICSAGSCGTGTGNELVPRKFKLLGTVDGGYLTASGMFVSADPIDPAATGVTLEVADDAGAVLYGASVPGIAIATRKETRFRYLASPAQMPSTGGIRALVLKLKKGVWFTTVRASAPGLSAALGRERLTWVLRFGDLCVRGMDLACVSGGLSASCR